MGGKGKIHIERLNENNFRIWKIQIEDHLYQKDLYPSLGGMKPVELEQPK